MKTFKLLTLAIALALAPAVQAERLKDLASIAGVRQNQLMGYGLVVGLDGSGDQTTQTPFTVQSVASMLQQMGVALPPGTTLQLKNVAAVMVTTSLPAFAQPGQQIDVTVSSMGNAKSLRGGTLLMTPLKGADGQVYGMAQGNVLVGGVGAQAPGGGASVVVNHLSVGRISNGATVERAVPTTLGDGNQIRLELNNTDFATASRVVTAINDKYGAGVAYAQDGRTIRVTAPSSSDARVAFIGDLESLDVRPARQAAKVIMNARTGSVVMNQEVTLETCAISHGNLSVSVSADTQVSQPNPLSGGQTVVAQQGNVDIKKDAGKVIMLKGGASLAEVVKALNAIGASPQDLLAILQAMKAAGSLRAELKSFEDAAMIPRTGTTDLNNGLAIDSKGFGDLRQSARAGSPEALKTTAVQFEAMFVNMMLKSMRDATPQEGMLDNQQSKMFTTMLDQQTSQDIAKKGLGLADVLVRQLSKTLQQQDVSAGDPMARALLDQAKLQRSIEASGGASAMAGKASTAAADKPAHVRAFQDKLSSHAEEASRASGIPAKFMLGQAALESGWGRREIKGRDGSNSHNLFGIKAGPDWKGRVVETATTEYVNGKPQVRVEKFRAYDSYADSFKDYARLITRNPRYEKALAAANGTDAAGFAQNLQRAGYATDPNYATKLASIIKKTLA